jgi:hypothetical protein
VKHRIYQNGDERVCELKAVPTGAIRYTVDGSSPETSGVAYDVPFVVPPDARVILAQATADGVSSDTSG